MFLSALLGANSKGDVLEMISFENGGVFTSDFRSSIYRSVAVGLVSLTFAQFKLGLNNKHHVSNKDKKALKILQLVLLFFQTDATFAAKAVYLASCLLNSGSVVVVEASYLFLAVATSVGLVVLDVFEHCCGFNADPNITSVILFVNVFYLFIAFPWALISRMVRWPLERFFLQTREESFIKILCLLLDGEPEARHL